MLVYCIELFAYMRSPWVVHSKAQLAGNGGALVKSCNAAVGNPGASLRVSHKTASCFVASSCNRPTMTAKMRLTSDRFMTHSYRQIVQYSTLDSQNGLYFNTCTFGQRSYLDAGPGRVGLLQKAGHYRIDLAEVLQVGQ